MDREIVLAPHTQAITADDNMTVDCYGYTLRNEGTAVCVVDNQIHLQPAAALNGAGETMIVATDSNRRIKHTINLKFATTGAKRVILITMRPTSIH